MSHYDAILNSPAVEALHAARSALTVAGGRVALAQRHLNRGDATERIAIDLASVPEHLARIAAAIDSLAQAAIACEGASPYLAFSSEPQTVH